MLLYINIKNDDSKVNIEGLIETRNKLIEVIIIINIT